MKIVLILSGVPHPPRPRSRRGGRPGRMESTAMGDRATGNHDRQCLGHAGRGAGRGARDLLSSEADEKGILVVMAERCCLMPRSESCRGTGNKGILTGGTRQSSKFLELSHFPLRG